MPVKFGDRNQPSDFTITHKKTVFIDEIPPQIRHLLPPELLAEYASVHPGSLNEVYKTEYGVIIDPEGPVFIGRDITYRLRDVAKAIHKVKESGNPKKSQVRITAPEMIDDQDLQARINADFDKLLSELGTVEQDWIDDELLSTQIARINAIMNSLVTGRPVAKSD